MEDKKKSTVSMQRRIQVYPTQKVYGKLEEFRVKNEMSRSEAVSFILKQHLDPPPKKHTY